MLRYHNIICISDPGSRAAVSGVQKSKDQHINPFSRCGAHLQYLYYCILSAADCSDALTPSRRVPGGSGPVRRRRRTVAVAFVSGARSGAGQIPDRECIGVRPESRRTYVYSPAVGRLFAGSGEPWGVRPRADWRTILSHACLRSGNMRPSAAHSVQTGSIMPTDLETVPPGRRRLVGSIQAMPAGSASKCLHQPTEGSALAQRRIRRRREE